MEFIAIKNVSVVIELEVSEKESLIRAYKIIKNISDDLWRDDLEDTEEAIAVATAIDGMQYFMNHVRIDYSED